jgi:hypothetical protein
MVAVGLMELALHRTSAHVQKDGQVVIVISPFALKNATMVVHALLQTRASALLSGLAERVRSQDVLV